MSIHQPIYELSKTDVYQALETTSSGLNAEEVRHRLDLYGSNTLVNPAGRPFWQNYRGFLIHPMAIMLWLAGGMLLFLGHIDLGLMIWLIVLVNGSLSFWREYRAKRAVDSLSDFLPVYARVTRCGEDSSVRARELVPGDVLVLSEGDAIPADARVIEAFGMRVNNSSLTGEAVAVLKTADASRRSDLSEIEQPNLIFAGTSVIAGTGRAVVYATGMQTQFGRVTQLSQSIEDEPSDLQNELKKFSRRISFVSVGLGALVLFSAIVDVKLPFIAALALATGMIVAVIPEGLIATLTLILAMGVQRLAQQGVLVKKISKLETLGTISVVCTDKSGTLTQNQMTVCHLWLDRKILDVSGSGYHPKGQIQLPNGKPCNIQTQPSLESFLTASILCNNSRLISPHDGSPHWGYLGDQTEAALLVLARKGGVEDQSQTYSRFHELPFDARRKRMSTLHTSPGGEIAFIKGAPKEVLALCECVLISGQECRLTNELRAEILAANDHFARQALRVLALARRSLPSRTGVYTVEAVENHLVFLGLAAMMDPPRPEVARTVSSFRSAGIRMAMITGDYGLTAESLGRRIGMISGPAPQIITGADLDALSDAELKSALDEETIFARMAPDHKLRLVAAFQQRGDVVAVIGDGVNDTPALRKADVGIAMGVGGTDVAREAADVIITNDNFELIVQAIEEGRTVYQNLRKFIGYIFASNVPVVLSFVVASFLKIPLAINLAQILAIDLVTNLLPALGLGLEKPEPDYMRRPPRARSQPIIDQGLVIRSFFWLGLIEAALCYLGYIAVLTDLPIIKWLYNLLPGIFPGPMNRLDTPQGQAMLASTVFFAGVVTAQIGNAFACRSEKGNLRWRGLFSNRYLLGGIAFEMALVFAMIYFPPIAALLGHSPLPLGFWLGLMLYAPILYGLERLRKTITRELIAKKRSDGKNGG